METSLCLDNWGRHYRYCLSSLFTTGDGRGVITRTGRRKWGDG